MLLLGSGTRISGSIDQFGKPAPFKQCPKSLTAKAGVRWKRPQEWRKVKVVSPLAEWSFVCEEPSIVYVAYVCGLWSWLFTARFLEWITKFD